jgi:hypothetical protein
LAGITGQGKISLFNFKAAFSFLSAWFHAPKYDSQPELIET